MRLYLFRHAKSSWKTEELDDFHRPLNGRGRTAAPAMGAYMAREGIRPELILCSLASRARETLALILPHLEHDTVIRIEHDLYLADSAHLFRRIRENTSESVMVIGHNPGLQDLATHLITPADTASHRALHSKLPTAALVEIVADTASWAELTPHGCSLARFITPKWLDTAEFD